MRGKLGTMMMTLPHRQGASVSVTRLTFNSCEGRFVENTMRFLSFCVDVTKCTPDASYNPSPNPIKATEVLA